MPMYKNQNDTDGHKGICRQRPVAQHGSGISFFVADKVICKQHPIQFTSPGTAGSLDGLATSLWCVWSCLGLRWIF